MNQFCDNCNFVNKKEDRCSKYNNEFLPRNIENRLFRCEQCKKEENNHESKNKT